MNPDDRKPLSGSLLLAAPSLLDPHFFHTVLLLAAHDKTEGAFGYILNRPLERKVADLIEDEDLGQLGEVPVFLGGPVNTNKLSFVALDWSNRKSSVRVHSHLSAEQAQKQLERGLTVRGFVGYSGWAEGQLEDELEQKSWITCEPPSKAMMNRSPEELWKTIMRNLGPYYKMLSSMPADPSLN